MRDYTGREEAAAATPFGRAMSALVNEDNFAEYRPLIERLLLGQGLHPTQAERILDNCRERMAEGMEHALALAQAITAEGKPAVKKEIFWDDP